MPIIGIPPYNCIQTCSQYTESIVNIYPVKKEKQLHVCEKFWAEMWWQREVSELTAIPDTTQTPKGVNWEWWAASELASSDDCVSV